MVATNIVDSPSHGILALTQCPGAGCSTSHGTAAAVPASAVTTQ